VPAENPRAEIDVLVNQTQYLSDGGHRVQDTEDPDAYHQFFQFLRAPRAVVFHYFSDATQRDESRHPEHCTQDQIHHQWNKDHVTHGSVIAPDG